MHAQHTHAHNLLPMSQGRAGQLVVRHMASPHVLKDNLTAREGHADKWDVLDANALKRQPPPPPIVADHLGALATTQQQMRERRPKRADASPQQSRVVRYPNGGLSAGGYHSAVVDASGKLFVFGCNAQGQLGLGHTDDVDTPTPLEDAFDGAAIDHVSCGTSHTAAVDCYGRLWMWGYGKAGLGAKPLPKPRGAMARLLKKAGTPPPELMPNSLKPLLVPSLENIRVRYVSCGWSHSALITSSFQLYTWGRGEHGKLGHGDEETVYEPKAVTALAQHEAQQVACGAAHTAIITRIGNVYCCGQGIACAVSKRGKVTTPVEVTTLTRANARVRQIACGAGHTACIAASGELFTWGWNKCGQLGTGTRTDSHVPQSVALPGRSTANRVACGAYHTVVSLGGGDLVTFGAGGKGEMGADGKPVALSRNGELGRLGIVGDEEERGGGDRLRAKTVSGPWKLSHQKTRVEHVSAGGYHTMFVTEAGELFSHGVGLNGRLGHGDAEPRVSPTLVKGFTSRAPILVNDNKSIKEKS